MPGLPIAIVPHPVAKLLPDEVAALAANVVDEIIRLWQTDAEDLRAEFKDKEPPVKKRLRYKSLFEGNFSAPDAPKLIKGPDDLEGVNRLFYSRGWTDGLPVIPPTPERYEAMLGDSGLDPEQLLALIEPRQGQATVAKIVINAVMAGCLPEHLPVLLAAAKALGQSALNLKALNTTTHPCTVLALISGPVNDEIDVNTTYNTMGQGSLANAAIGRAIRSILLNVGGGTPGILDRATMGTPAKFSFCFGENQDENPWGETLAMERGFAADQSTITLCGVEGPHNVNDHYGKGAEEILQTIGGTMCSPGLNNSYLGGEIMLVLGPEHAEIIHKDGFSKADIKNWLIENAVIPAHVLSEPQRVIMRQYVPERLLANGDQGARIATTHADIQLVVAGGAGRHSAIIPSFGNTRAVTEVI
ncbi:MAG: hypothetical protein HOK21_09815 [Rhodospirillaceae bacterium]|jgi:hypothetical protein|nr:hypothetical protein [Rhodospirillaceae bacterium]MBT4691426.1 hypothetical protein [Rhodospirillaceae bacterium]MBT5082929.1 hypothetical protein [Rhodospirillaceae bacterium]MBT5524373.1 hypothetical protein [Rhodospirillaceae bacterium]MBT5878831.1 hypothetical protein [Rhodospirillaceae bacterium]